ncbi:hypothetical protein LSUE1_G006727 [Lachnellula suecica]|uniref:TM7S3/TM198-like domain-containing protein n=1 Tax=Lachnellula suecica TaxID=602035 RepID=A0A8T9C2Q4_9HELO|nr:hypothetical protein LSUE1_G006727 [Lachnellula suecica]
MVYAMKSKLLAIVLLCFCIRIVVAERWGVHIHRRDGPTTPSITSTDISTSPSPSNQPSQSSSGSNGGGSTTNNVSDKTSSGSSKATATTASSATSSSGFTSSTSATSTPAVASNLLGAAPTSSLENNSTFNSTATPDTLPLTPQLTPGFGVAGVILMISGAIYTIIGIKNKMLHIFLSAGYLASLAVTVLIIYVMNLPVSNAVQGAYVVAAVVTGFILGGGAIIFSEMTEGLGCLLGGFCFSMWLLVLRPGGLITSTGGKAILIAVFTVAGFATSFHHYTRPYALMILLSFGGATTVVIGIDCFSRAGLKEFWAYLWNLNGNLFPIGATTYPLTRGIKVEIAAIIIIFLAGIISQMKLWKVIKERREGRAAERLEDERTIEREEENAGRRVENLNAEDRQQWETVYGDKDQINKNQRDSGFGDMDSQKKGTMSVVTSIRRSREDEIEMSEMASPTTITGVGLVIPSKGQDGGPVTIRVARDADPEPERDENENPIEQARTPIGHASTRSSIQLNPEEEQIWVVGADGEARLERRPSRRHSKRMSNPMASARASGAPEIIPLPFKVPEGEADDDRSSVATFADDEHPGQQDRKRFSNRLSTGSAMLRKLAKKQQRSSSRLSKRFSLREGPSTDSLVIPRETEDDRASSVAATMDGLSDDEEMMSRRSSMDKVPDTSEARSPDLANAPVLPGLSGSHDAVTGSEPSTDTGKKDQIKSQNHLEEEPAAQNSLISSTDPKLEFQPASTAETLEQSEADKPKAAPSVISAAESKSNSITKDNLPPQLSRVVMSYRTNEWAKHLSNADTPEADELSVEESPVENKVHEVVAPVMVEELSQTSESTLPQPAPRSISTLSNHNAPPLTRSSSSQSKIATAPQQSRPEIVTSFAGQEPSLQRNLSQQSLQGQSQANLNRFRNSSSPIIPQPIVESPIEEDFPSPNFPETKQFPNPAVPFGRSNTLIGKRDTMMRNKSSFINSQTALASTPENPAPQYGNVPLSRTVSDAGSIYNYKNNMSNSVLPEEDDNMSLSARRNLIRQSSLQQIATPIAPLQQTPTPFDSHQPRRQSSAPSHMVREQQLASWRASVQQDLQSTVVPKMTVERQRSALWQERQAEEQRKAISTRIKGERDNAFDERMRRGDMLSAHREALSKMQASANKRA